MTDLKYSTWGFLSDGKYKNHYIQIEEDETKAGFHIWVMKRDLRNEPVQTDGWDVWADNETDLEEWLNGDFKSVEWLND